MQTVNSSNSLHQYYLGKLQQILDLAMQTAETASTEGNHKIVLQAVREVTRIITLMTKIDGISGQAATQATPKTPAPAVPDSEIKALTDGLVQDMLNIFPGLADTPTTANRKIQADNRPFQKWEKSGKSAGKNRR